MDGRGALFATGHAGADVEDACGHAAVRHWCRKMGVAAVDDDIALFQMWRTRSIILSTVSLAFTISITRRGR